MIVSSEGISAFNRQIDTVAQMLIFFCGHVPIDTMKLLAEDCAKEITNEEDKIKFWIAGGAIRSAIADDKINDYDVFSDRPNDLIERLENTTLQKAYGAQLDVPVFINKTFEGEGFTNLYFGRDGDIFKVQVIQRYEIKDIEVLFDTFDFTIVKGAYDGFKFYCDDRFWQDVACKRLVVNGQLPFPLKTLERLAKYSRRGYTACPVGLLKLATAINEMDINDKNDLTFYADGTPRFNGVD